MGARELLEDLGSEDESVSHRAFLMLGGCGRGEREWVPDLIAGTEQEHHFVRFSAAVALGRIGRDAAEAVPALVAMLSDSAFGNRQAAAGALAKIGPPAIEAAVPALVDVLGSDDSHFVRQDAVNALGRLAVFDADVVPAVAAGLDDPHEWVRGEAATQLGVLGGRAEQALPALARLLERDGEAEHVRSQAMTALETIGGGAPALRLDEPYHSLSEAADIGRFSEADLPGEVRARLDEEDFGAALDLLEEGGTGDQDSMFWLYMFTGAREFELPEAGRYYERYLETSGLGGFQREMEAAVYSNRTVVQGMRRIVRYCAKVNPDPRWKAFYKLDVEDDLRRLQGWLEGVLTDEPPPAAITGLWFGLVNLDRDGNQTLDMYIAGERHQSDPTAQVIGGSWQPRRAYANSHVLDRIAEATSLHDGGPLGDAEYRLGLTYGGLAVRWLAAAVDSDLLLGGSPQRVMQVGFDEGDYIPIGTLTREGLAFHKT